MKRKIVIGLCTIFAIFSLGGIYIVFSIEYATEKLDTLIQLHQVEILREHYLLQIKSVQSDLILKGTQYSRGFDTVVRNVIMMGVFVDTCYDCHHTPEIFRKLDALKGKTQEYANALSRVLTIRANEERLNHEKEIAFRLGEELTNQVGEMIAFTSSKLAVKTEAALNGIRNTKYILYALMVIVPLFCLGFALVFIRGLTGPMESLLDSTRRLKNGELDHRIGGLKYEFGELAVSINEMANSLKEKMDEMDHARRELAKANRELEIAQEQMVRAETMAAIGTLSSGISHELSTPLSVILNMTQLNKQDAKTNPALLKDLEVIEYEANQAIKITRSLLGFAQSTRSKTEIVNVNEILENLFKIMQFQPKAKQVRLEKNLDENLAFVRGSAGQLRQVFLNVILNALQAMPQGGRLTVTTNNRSDNNIRGVEVTVNDTGKGIPKEDQKKIFQPFFTTKVEGTGLGLAITFGIIQDHNGRIEVDSEEGKGTTFSIFLPVGDERET